MSTPSRAILVSLSVLFVAAHGWAATRGGTWWGWHHLRYLDGAGRLALAAAVALAIGLTLPPVRRRLARLPALAGDATLALAAGGIAWAFRDRTHLLGDGSVILERSAGPLLYHDREPLSAVGSWLVARGSSALALDVATGFELASVLLGVGVVFLLARADRAARAGGVLLLLGFVHGAAQLWFGYVESYPLVAFVVVTALLAARPVVTRPASVFPLLGLGALAILLHVSSVTLLPAVAWCVVRQLRLRPTGRARALVLVEIAAAGLAAEALWRITWAGRDAPSLLGYLSILEQTGRFGYGSAGAIEAGASPTFSLAHLAEWTNQVALLAALALPVAIAGALAAGRRAWREDPWLAPLAIASVSYLAAQFQFFPALGAPRDWDVLAVGAFPLGLLAARLVAPRDLGKRALPWLAGLAAFHVAPWLLVNADPAAAHRRFAEVPLPAGQARFVFATRALKDGRLDEARLGFEEVLRGHPGSVHAWHRLGVVRDRLGDPAGALAAYERTLALHEIDPRVSRSELLERIGSCQMRLGRSEAAVDSFERALAENPESVTARVFLGVAASRGGRPEEVLRLLEPALPHREKNPAILVLTARALLALGRDAEAESRIREAARLFPEDPAVRALSRPPSPSRPAPRLDTPEGRN